jgi:hypothetical protein
MRRRMRWLLVGTIAIVPLSACHQGQKAGHGEVSGQILPGSVSDAMLPYDAVKSKPPLAPREATEPGDKTTNDDTPDSPDTPADAPVPDVPASPVPIVPPPVN